MAVDSATTAGPQPQARSTAEDGRARLSCFARNARIRGPRGLGARGGRAGEESRRPAVAGLRPASGSECIAAPDPPAQGRRDAAVPSRQGEPRLKRPSPAMTGSTAPPTQAAHGKKARSPVHDRMGKARYAGASAQSSAASMRTQGVSPRSDAAARLTPKIETRPPTTRRSTHRAL